jgi:hypothetical protein
MNPSHDPACVDASLSYVAEWKGEKVEEWKGGRRAVMSE